MRAHDSRPESANVVAVFDDQLDADEAVLQLRASGFRDNRIGYFSRSMFGDLTDLLGRNYVVPGAILGGILGAALGIATAVGLSEWWAARVGVRDMFGLAITLGVAGAMFVGFFGAWIGMGLSRRGLPAPAIDPSVGPLIVEVAAGDASDQAWAIIRRHGGHEPPPGATMAHPAPAV